jgi:MinD-like ATPase involved in chromosome partitioning or flagellar assembly
MNTMTPIVTISSFRRGTGKSSLITNLAVLLAMRGRRVALVDTDFQAPSLDLFFGLSDREVKQTLNDYLLDKCDILSTVSDVTSKLGSGSNGKLYVSPASDKISDIMQFIRTPLDIDRYMNGLDKMGKELALDMLLVDTPAGLTQDTLQSMAVSNTVILVLHPDKHDFQGTAVMVDMVHRLQVPAVHLVLNDVPDNLNEEDARLQLEKTYHCDGLVLGHTEELMTLASAQPFALRYPEHPLTAKIKELADLL